MQLVVHAKRLTISVIKMPGNSGRFLVLFRFYFVTTKVLFGFNVFSVLTRFRVVLHELQLIRGVHRVLARNIGAVPS